MIAETRDFRFSVASYGNPDLQPVVFLHGFLGSSQDWKTVASTLAHHYTVYLPDLPGHGNTMITDAATCSFENVVENLADMIRQLPGPPPHLAGYSMGGRLALALLCCVPELFRSGVIVSSSPGIADRAKRRLRAESDDRLASNLKEDFCGFLDYWYALPLFAELRKHASFSEILDKRRKNCPDQLALALKKMSTGRQPSYWNCLENIRLPLLFIAGEKDTKYVEIGRQMVNLCPDSILEIIPGCGHTPQFEQRRMVTGRLLNFFNTLDHHDL
ncbi:2-succinyl-6-hydroxy-2,4-cyclohexadiene-1-carboxylate synthase [Prosthecochloris sp. HL-130-GSB]|jgi:2-succinyl-6-hydroxy-2,4-cyclohexadiene-1-carboxylate synthase|uniref:2-succinyl-6-hydroxy-2, 4-cyclohexadiene-1-carboxylate synthase n=1 Tax=Prosthecochloris sp. HL-130-GSB TaxID=1974213 RepID=UPI000A1C10A8|nr:2-succinyl-6-hydroxy-2,4-cyclohexadiene-1-carboxylate synthase [Prosthecochloris sp. HL-130-GSB]ARM31479.1 2-succinyl-6-hydroxy-2,4-cyclohexadiene-1-carboxylate synthase [Prosthecochloris sp. HL-130-GSB]MBO8092850.1 2-succinyl-6-hydroxy-2,4-cyclohexadiene-1-carboxylate synthase [Prosthecochloris sp.]